MLQRVDVNFANYVLSNWLPITRKWSIHAQTGLVHFGNTTNNRLESANRHLKRHTNPCDALVTAVRKVSDYSRNQLVDGAMKASHGSDRRLLVTAECAVQGVLHRMTTYAAAQFIKHLKNKRTDLHHVHVNPSKVIKVLVKFYSRHWCMNITKHLSLTWTVAHATADSTKQCGFLVTTSFLYFATSA